MLRFFTLLPTDIGRRLARFDVTQTVYEPYSRFGYRPRPGASEAFPNGTVAHYNAQRFRGPLVPLEKPPGTFRIILLGGSTTVGYGVNDDATIDSFLRQSLRRAFPGVCFDVINLALGGYDSYQDYERMRVEGVQFSPDLVVIHSGINDVRNARFPALADPPPDPRTLLWQGPLSEVRSATGYQPNAFATIKHFVYFARLPGLVRNILSTRRSLGTIQTAEAYPAAAEYFQENLRGPSRLRFAAGRR